MNLLIYVSGITERSYICNIWNAHVDHIVCEASKASKRLCAFPTEMVRYSTIRPCTSLRAFRHAGLLNYLTQNLEMVQK